MHRNKPNPESRPEIVEHANESQDIRFGKQNIQVMVSDERLGDLAIQFKMPRREVLAASANRLLRFEFPPARDLKAYERLIKTHVVSAGLSKKTLEHLPLPTLEQMYRQVWEHFLGAEATAEDTLLSLCLLIEDLSEFSPTRLLMEDMQTLGLRESGTVHSYYYQEQPEPTDLRHFLTQHGYPDHWLEQSEKQSKISDANRSAFQYLACRKLSRPLPWSILLDSLTPAESKKFNRLGRFKQLRQLLQKQSWYAQALSKGVRNAKSLHQFGDAYRKFLQSKEAQRICADCQTIAPVQTLVLVEGETERLLLPRFAKAAGSDFQALGIEIWPAGGKNYVPTLYQEAARNLKIPIAIVLDSDAKRTARELQAVLRPEDRLFQIEEGEFEDTYDQGLMLETINQVYQPYPELTAGRFAEITADAQATGRVQALKAVWQAYHLGSFDKIAFAEQYAEQFEAQSTSLSPTMLKLLDCILQAHPGKR